MRILFDQGTPVPLRKALTNHEVTTAYERGWSELKNGELLNAAEEEGFEVFVTTDSNLKYQQNLQSRRIAIIVLTTTSWPRIRQAIETVVLAVDGASEGMYVEVAIPR
jgi:predicted nuclease of predicted toxin-antitoxin system